MPKRPRSERGAPEVIISIAQQASPKVAGHSDALRVQLTRLSTLASTIPFGSFSSSPMLLAPVQPAAAPHVGVGEGDGGDEQHDLDETEQPERVDVHRERVEEDHLDVE